MLYCEKCGEELKIGDECIEINRSIISDTATVIPKETEALLCEECEELVMPALWADINEV